MKKVYQVLLLFFVIFIFISVGIYKMADSITSPDFKELPNFSPGPVESNTIRNNMYGVKFRYTITRYLDGFTFEELHSRPINIHVNSDGDMTAEQLRTALQKHIAEEEGIPIYQVIIHSSLNKPMSRNAVTAVVATIFAAAAMIWFIIRAEKKNNAHPPTY